MNIILVRQREKQLQLEMVDGNRDDQIAVNTKDMVSVNKNKQSEEIVNGEYQEQVARDIEALEPTEQIAHSGAVLTEEDKEQERFFIMELEKMTSISMQQLERQVKLP